MTSTSTWAIEQSHCIAHPSSIETEDVSELRSWVQYFADSKVNTMGKIHFRYELDDTDHITTVHCYFTNKHGKLQRFMRLRKVVE